MTFKLDRGFVVSAAVGTLVGTFLDELFGLEEIAERLAAYVRSLLGWPAPGSV
jgi:F0F1-type ATP synthase assembly protein I